MAFTARIAELEITVEGTDEQPDLGQPGAGRQISLVCSTDLATKDLRLAFLSALNLRLQGGCDLVLQSTEETAAVKLRLWPGGDASIVLDEYSELSPKLFYRIVAYSEPFTNPANRFYMASPFGEEWPNTSLIARGSSKAVYAQGGRYRITANSASATYDPWLVFVGNCAAGEWLVYEADYQLVASASSYGFYVVATFHDQSGNQIGHDLKCAVEGSFATGTFHVRAVYRAPATARTTRFSFYHNNPYGNCDAWVWDVVCGERVLTHPIASPHVNDEPRWSNSSWPENEYTCNGSWSYLNGYAVFVGSGSYSPVLLNTQNQDCTPGMVLGVRLYKQVYNRTSGVVQPYVIFSDAAGGTVSTVKLDDWYGNDGAPGQLIYRVTVPVGAVSARACVQVAGSSALTFKVSAFDFGQHVCAAPGKISLSELKTEAPAPLDVYCVSGNTTRLDLGVAPDDGSPYIWEAESLSWVGGSVGAAAAPQFSGGLAEYVIGATTSTASIDTELVRFGAYELLARVCAISGYTADFYCTTTGGHASTNSAYPVWKSLGQIHLPPKRAQAGVASNMTVTMVCQTGGNGYVDQYMLIPLSFGGHASFDGGTYSNIYAEGGALYLNGSANATISSAGRMFATGLDRLIINAAMPSSTEAYHWAGFLALATPQYGLFA